MKKNYHPIGIFIFFLCFSITGMAQNSPSKFGKINAKDFEPATCPIDSNAHAYFIFDCGLSQFEYANKTIDSRFSSSNKGFQLIFNRHLRIHILDEQAYSWANFEIPLYHSENNSEKVSRLKAITYNLEKGKVEKTKLENNSVSTEETSENWDKMKFAMPNVKAGSIIEVEYTVISDFYFNLQEWYFQRSIPTLTSNYRVEIPEYFRYNMSQSGYFNINTTNSERRKSLKLTYKEASVGFKEGGTYDHTFTYQEMTTEFDAKNIPAFPEEQFLKTATNYLSKIEFELESTQFDHGAVTYYTTSWEDIDKKLQESENFGRAIARTGFLKDDVEMLKSQGTEGTALAAMAFNQIKKQISWNGITSKYVSSSLGKAYKDHSGNCAEVNLSLVALLSELGFDAYPVILSTRANGIIHPAHPSVSRFNYVVAMVVLENHPCLLDATDPESGINMLPIRCLNDKGRIIGDLPDKWINLVDYMPFEVTANYRLTIDENLDFAGTARLRLSDYAAYQERKEIGETNDMEEYEKKKKEENEDYLLTNLKVDGLDTGDKIELSYEMAFENKLDNANNMLYFSPVAEPFFDENPFKLEVREFPVEFSYPYKIQQSCTIMIPENYEISELPKPLAASLPNSNGRFMYQVKSFGNSISMTYVFMLNKSVFLPDEYQALKQFFQMVIDKQNELVVLKSI